MWMLRASSVYSMFTVGGWRGDSPFPEKEIQVRSTTFIQRSLGSNFNFTSTVVWLASNREPTSVSCTTFRNAESAWRSSLAPCGTSSKVGARHGPACHVWFYFQPPTAGGTEGYMRDLWPFDFQVVKCLVPCSTTVFDVMFVFPTFFLYFFVSQNNMLLTT